MQSLAQISSLSMVPTQQSLPSITQSQPLMLVYGSYRLAITLVIWALFFANSGIGEIRPALFIAAGVIYLVVNSSLLLAIARNWCPSFGWLLAIIGSDIILIQLIAHVSGQLGSGLSVLMIVSVAAGSLFLERRTSLIVPAFATIALLSGVAIGILYQTATKSDLVTSGWLGLTFFIVNAFVSYLAARVKTSEALAEREHSHAKHMERLNSLIIERMQTGIVIVNADGNIVSYNQAALQLLGDENSRQLATLASIDTKCAAFEQAIQSQRAHNVEAHKQPAPYSMELEKQGTKIRLTWAKLGKHASAESLIFIEDLSRIAQQAQQLKLSSLGKLTASIAHEIRNPLGAVSHAAQLLEEQNLSNEDGRLSAIIVEQAKRCSNIIESVLSVSRGKPSIVRQFDLAEWLPAFIKNYQLGKECTIHLATPSTQTIQFDPAQLEQVLTNLLDNALRFSFSATGKQFAVIRVTEDQTERPRLEVFDAGPGVDNTDKQRLFEPFFTKGKTGSGLGLYISRELCEANQSTLHYVDQSILDSQQAKWLSLATTSQVHCFRIQFSHPDRVAFNLENEHAPAQEKS